jgi:glycosyltransferase involved in cell wall biosynthesis
VIYRPTDLYSQLKHDHLLSQVERRLLDRAHGVVATSAPVLDHVQAMRADLPALLLENGVDCDHFTTPQKEPPDLFGIPRPRAIYVGAVDDRFDDRLLHAVTAENPRVSFIVIGGQTREHGVGSKGNVFYLGQRRYADIPGYLQSSDLAVMPLTRNPANQGRSPMKVFEFGAAGLPVVATATAELRRRNLPFVFLAESESDFARLCTQLAHSNTEPLRVQARRSAASHGWSGKSEQLLAFAETLVRDRGARPAFAPYGSG